MKVESLLTTEEGYAALIVKVREDNASLNSQIQYISAEHDSFKYPPPVCKVTPVILHNVASPDTLPLGGVPDFPDPRIGGGDVTKVKPLDAPKLIWWRQVDV